MTPVQARRLEFAAAVDRDGRISAEGGAPVELADEWTPEHLALAALARCTIASLAYHAGRAEITAAASASASGVVTKRQEDGRYAFVELACRMNVELDPAPTAGALTELIGKAERDCFVGASFRVKPAYAWRVNGAEEV